jgi:hypothetical protein
MTFADLAKIVGLNSHESANQQSLLFERLRDKPFWIWDIEQHKQQDRITKGDCCFNHIIGLPKKEGIEKPLFDYQKLLYDSLFDNDFNNPLELSHKHKHLWVLKATGLGVTEFYLRLMVWLSLVDDTYSNSQMCIVCGPNQDIAIKLIKRIKSLFEPHNIIFSDKETVLVLNGCTIEAYPSNHLDAYRSLENPKFILIDESDFFRKSDMQDVRHVSERYIAKSSPYIVMVSTPNAPNGLMETIEKESEETCIYKRLKLDYTYGLDKIYSRADIAKAKISPSFEREYNLLYLGLIGNVFHTEDINAAIELGNQYDPFDHYSTSTLLGRVMAVDPGFGSSSCAIVITQFRDKYIEVIYAEDFERPLYDQIIEHIIKLNNKHHVGRIFVDASNAAFTTSIKHKVNDYDFRTYATNEKSIISDINDPRLRQNSSNVVVFPVNFKIHKEMLSHTYELLSAHQIRINPTFSKLITSLRTALVNDRWSLDKDATSFDDILDSFQMCLMNYTRRKRHETSIMVSS